MKNSPAQNRAKFALGNKFDSHPSEESALFLLSPSDIGVRRNLGRNGTRYAPKAILNVLKKFNNHNDNLSLKKVEVTSQEREKENFEAAQLESAKAITKEIENIKPKKVIHIGGGHDHAFPLLMAMDQLDHFENILIINIDAHCDTRVDTIHHSGTPFRNYAQKAKKPFHLIQYGVQKLANSSETLSPLESGTQEKIFMDNLKRKTENFQKPVKDLLVSSSFEITEKTAIFFSLDSDAISGSEMKAVSAVNPDGIPLNHIKDLLRQLRGVSQNIYMGIYEYNPIFDDLSQLGARSLSSLIYDFLEE